MDLQNLLELVLRWEQERFEFDSGFIRRPLRSPAVPDMIHQAPSKRPGRDPKKVLAVFPIDRPKSHQLKEDTINQRRRLQAAVGAAVLKDSPAHALQFRINGFRQRVLGRGITLRQPFQVDSNFVELASVIHEINVSIVTLTSRLVLLSPENCVISSEERTAPWQSWRDFQIDNRIIRKLGLA